MAYLLLLDDKQRRASRPAKLPWDADSRRTAPGHGTSGHGRADKDRGSGSGGVAGAGAESSHQSGGGASDRDGRAQGAGGGLPTGSSGTGIRAWLKNTFTKGSPSGSDGGEAGGHGGGGGGHRHHHSQQAQQPQPSNPRRGSMDPYGAHTRAPTHGVTPAELRRGSMEGGRAKNPVNDRHWSSDGGEKNKLAAGGSSGGAAGARRQA